MYQSLISFTKNLFTSKQIQIQITGIDAIQDINTLIGVGYVIKVFKNNISGAEVFTNRYYSKNKTIYVFHSQLDTTKINANYAVFNYPYNDYCAIIDYEKKNMEKYTIAQIKNKIVKHYYKLIAPPTITYNNL